MNRFTRHIFLAVTAMLMVATAEAQENMKVLLGVNFDTFFDNTEYSGSSLGESGTIFHSVIALEEHLAVAVVFCRDAQAGVLLDAADVYRLALFVGEVVVLLVGRTHYARCLLV